MTDNSLLLKLDLDILDRAIETDANAYLMVDLDRKNGRYLILNDKERKQRRKQKKKKEKKRKKEAEKRKKEKEKSRKSKEEEEKRNIVTFLGDYDQRLQFQASMEDACMVFFTIVMVVVAVIMLLCIVNASSNFIDYSSIGTIIAGLVMVLPLLSEIDWSGLLGINYSGNSHPEIDTKLEYDENWNLVTAEPDFNRMGIVRFKSEKQADGSYLLHRAQD